MAQDLFSQLALQTLSEISAADSPASSASTGQTGQAQASQSAPSPTRSPKMVISPFMVDAIASEEGLTDTQKQVMTALLNQESNYGRNARTSTDGARGVGQIMPATFQRYARPGERIDDPAHNLAVMSRIVKDAGSKFGDDPAKIATAYFSGDGNVNRGQGSAWKADRADGNGKRVSSYVSDIVSRMGVAPRQSEQPQEWDQGARYAPVGLAYQVTKEPRPAEKPSKRAGFWEGAADVGLSTAQGVVGSVKALTDLAGADNVASRGLDDASKGLEKLKSDASQADRQYHQQKIKEAEASGDWKDEVAAYANMVWDMPLESLAQGVGSFATLGAGKVAQMAKLASAAKKAGVAKEAFLKTAQGIEAARKASDLGMKVNVGLGVGQGIGGVKGSQYEQTFNAAKESGLSDEQAKTLATEAQSYQQGWGQQALGAGLGYVAGKTGPIEKLAAGKTVGAGGVARRFVGGGLVEAGTEGLQGGQERYAGNAAAIDAGVLDPSMQWAGVAGSGASEAITAGVLGGGAGALGRPDVDPQAQAKAAAQKSGGIVSRAGLAATPGAQPPAQPGANPSTPPNPGTPPAGGPTGANGAQPPAQPGAGQQAPGQPSAGQPVTGTNPAAPSQAGPRAKQLGSTANPFVGLFDTDEVYGKWSNLRDGSDRDSMRQLMTDVFKLYANANLSPYDPASLKYELQQGHKWFRSASPQQQDAGVAAIFAAAGKQPAVSTPSAKPGQAPAAPANPIQASAQSAIEQALVEDKARRRAAGEVVEDDDEVTDVEVKPASAERDPMLDQAVEFVKQSGKPSINAVQRQFKIGYNRAARLLEDMERDGIVGPLQADGLRQVLKPAAPPAAAPAPQQPASAGFSLPAFDNSPIPKMDPAAAEEQRRQAAEFEQKRKNRLAGTRAAVWERNPMLAFLGANGISRDAAGEFAPGLVERRKAFVPGYGPVFRPGAKNLDELVQTAKEDGFLREDDGEPELYDLIDRALRGERIAPLYADGVAEAEGQRRLQAMQERDGADFEDYLQQAEAEDFDPFPLMADSGYDEQDLAGTDFDQADDAARAEVAALAAQYADLGFDPADVLEALAIENENQPEQTYYDRARTRLTDLISQAYAQAQPQGSGAVRADRAEPLPSGEAGARGPAAGQQVRPAAPTPKLRNVDELAAEGFNRVVKQGGKTYFVNPDTRESVELDSPAQIARARARVQAKQRLGSLRGTRPQPFGLDAVTPKALKARDEQAQAAQAQQTAEQQAAAEKAKADDERKRIEQASYAAADNFELGQNPLDSLTGQQDIFGITQQDTAPAQINLDEMRRQLIKLEDRIVGAAGLAPGFIEEAMKSRKVPAELKRERNELRDKVRAERKRLEEAARTPAAPVAADLAGERINDEWTAFDPQSGTLGIPRAEMPQIKAEHRGAMVNFLKARGIDGQQETIPSAAIKPTQAEFSPAKVKQAMDYQGGNRSIIVSADGYVVDGHHQWLAAREKGEPIPAIRLDQNIGDVLAALKDMPSAQPDSASTLTPEQIAEQARVLLPTVRRYASGLTAIGDLAPGARASGGAQLRGVGVDVGLLSKNAIEVLGNAAVNQKAAVFVDSGAFSAFRRGLKSGEFEPLDFNAILARYDAILDSIGRHAEEGGEQTNYPRPLLVMPDVVGSQADSLALIREHRNWISAEVQGNLSQPIIPIQKGEMSMAEAYRQVVQLVGSDDFIVGIPSNEQAVTPDELQAFLADAKPKAIHILGAASDAKLQPRLESVVAAGLAGKIQVTADASPIRNKVIRAVAKGAKRGEVIESLLYDEKDPGYSPQKSDKDQAATGQQAPVFDAYADALQYVDDRAKALGLSKKQFTTTDEYKSLYPQIKALYDAEKASNDAERLQALKDAGLAAGDKVKTVVRGMFMSADEYTGTVVMRSGAPYVQIDGKMTVSRNGRLSETSLVRWDGRWTKDAGSQPTEASSDAEIQAATGQQWDGMTNAERLAIGLKAELPKAAANKWAIREWRYIDAKVRDKLAQAIGAGQEPDDSRVVYELPVDEAVFSDALGELVRGEAERDKATFDPDIQRISLPRITAASPKPPGVEFLSQEEANQVVQSWKDEAARQGQESSNYNRTVISLFDASGVMSAPWEEAGYNVVRYDIQNGDDINDFDAEMLLERHGNDNIWAIIAQPPCTDFASSGAQWWAEKDAKGLTEISNELVRQTMRTLELFRPPVWWLENPVGRMQRLNGLPDPVLSHDPWHFGDPWTKRTSYWGNFNPKLPTAMVEPVEGSKVHKLSSSAKFERSLTPEGVAYAMFMANNAEAMTVPERMAREFPGIEAQLFERALAAGQTEQDIVSSIEDSFYENDLDMVREILSAPRKGEVGMKLASGEQVLTNTGRKTTPFPKVSLDTNRKASNTLKLVDRWLMQNALDEARSRGDDFNARQFEANLEKPQQADKDAAEEYLFGGYIPTVVPSILKPLTTDGSRMAGREGYDTPVALDAAQLKAILEQTRGEPLVDKPAKLEAWRNGTAKTDPAKFPIELVFRPDGKLDVNDGRHRIALAAERGEKVTAFIDGKDAQRVKDLLKATGSMTASKDALQQRVEAVIARYEQTAMPDMAKMVRQGLEQRVKTSTLTEQNVEHWEDLLRRQLATRNIIEGVDSKSNPPVAPRNRTVEDLFKGDREEDSRLHVPQAVLDLVLAKANEFVQRAADLGVHLDEIDARFPKSVLDLRNQESALRGQFLRYANQRKAVERGYKNAKTDAFLEAEQELGDMLGVDLRAMREQQTAASGAVDPDLEAIFDQLDGLTQRTQANGQRAAAAHPQAERIQFVQKHILDILQDLEDTGKVTINC